MAKGWPATLNAALAETKTLVKVKTTCTTGVRKNIFNKRKKGINYHQSLKSVHAFHIMVNLNFNLTQAHGIYLFKIIIYIRIRYTFQILSKIFLRAASKRLRI